MKIKILLFILIIFFITSISTGQNIIEIIEKGQNSVANVSALDRNGKIVSSSVVFFISNDGLAITNSSLMQESDSIIFYDNNGKKIELNRIVALHAYANLAIVHFKTSRQQIYNYFTPSKIPYAGDSEILAFISKKDSDNGLSFGKIDKVKNCIVTGRIATINLQAGKASDCAPIIDGSGRFIGIYRYTDNKDKGVLLPVSLIADTTWISVNQTWTEFKSNPMREKLTTTLLCKSLIYMSEKNWLEAAQTLTTFFNYDHRNATVYALRALCRYYYGNNEGGNNDYNYATQLNSDDYIAYYAKAMHHVSLKDYRSALSDLWVSIEKKPDFAHAFLEIGKIQAQQNEIQKAHTSFTIAINCDSVLAEAWYERSKLMVLHSSNMTETLNDLSTAATLNPELIGVHYMMGTIKLRQRKYPEAILDFDKEIEKNPHDTNALVDRGMALYYNGSKNRACADWENASKIGNPQAIRMLKLYCTK